MALKLSTGLRNAMLDTGSFKATMADGFLKIYSGTPPATADAAVTGTLLCIISDNGTGTGLDLGAAASGAIPKDPAQVWSGTNVAGGTASYFRFVGNTDTGVSSTTEFRVQGTCGTSGADMNMTSVNLSLGAPQSADAASFTLPTF
jgi:hypothetical protein